MVKWAVCSPACLHAPTRASCDILGRLPQVRQAAPSLTNSHQNDHEYEHHIHVAGDSSQEHDDECACLHAPLKATWKLAWWHTQQWAATYSRLLQWRSQKCGSQHATWLPARVLTDSTRKHAHSRGHRLSCRLHRVSINTYRHPQGCIPCIIMHHSNVHTDQTQLGRPR